MSPTKTTTTATATTATATTKIPPYHIDLLQISPIVAFLDLADLCRLSHTCVTLYSTLKTRRKDLLRRLGVPPTLRWKYWEHETRVQYLFPPSPLSPISSSSTTTTTTTTITATPSPVLLLLQPQPQEDPTSNHTTNKTSHTPSELTILAEFQRCLGTRRGLHSLEQTGTEGEIFRDATRTFPRDSYFSSKEGQDKLADCLRAVATLVPSVGYCQGMNFVAATMLLTAKESPRSRLPPEVASFALLAALVQNFDMKDLWRPGVPQLKLRIFQFDRLLKELLPGLWAHFKHVGLTPDFFASQWFLTLLCINLPRKTLIRVWDTLLTDGWKTIFRVGICLLRSLETKIKDMSLEELGMFFKTSTGPLEAVDETDENWVISALNLKGISTRVLIELESQYVAHILAQQLSDNPDIHGAVAFVDRRVAAIVREEISRLDGPVRSDVSVLRSRIEQTEKALIEARSVFVDEARTYIEVQADVEELQDAKRAILDQIRVLSTTAAIGAQEEDFTVLQSKIEAVEAQLLIESARFGGILWRTAQAQIDLEEALERKKVFSEQLVLVMEQNESQRTIRMKSLFRELNV
jgi:hypothetical protein